MAPLRDAFRLKDIHPRLTSRTRSAALAELAAGLRDHPGIVSFDTVSEELLGKSGSLNTIIENHVWLPHLRSAAVRGVVICGGSWQQPAALDFPHDHSAGRPPEVRVALLILAQQGLVTEYLAAVGALARHLAAPGAVEKMAAAAAPEEWLSALLGG